MDNKTSNTPVVEPSFDSIIEKAELFYAKRNISGGGLPKDYSAKLDITIKLDGLTIAELIALLNHSSSPLVRLQSRIRGTLDKPGLGVEQINGLNGKLVIHASELAVKTPTVVSVSTMKTQYGKMTKEQRAEMQEFFDAQNDENE